VCARLQPSTEWTSANGNPPFILSGDGRCQWRVLFPILMRVVSHSWVRPSVSATIMWKIILVNLVGRGVLYINRIIQFLPATHTTTLTLLRKHSPDGTTRTRQYTFDIAHYSIYRSRKDERLSWPSWLIYNGRFTNINGHPSAAGRAWERESSLVKDHRSNHCATQQTYWCKMRNRLSQN